ncbi:MAG: hypothetical protein AAF327_22010 [Cyanobacteria bacterium P01_A01_bin.37]
MHVSLTETLNIFISGDRPRTLKLEYEVLEKINIGTNLLHGPIIKIECVQESILEQLIQDTGWIGALRNYSYVAFAIAGEARTCEPVNKSTGAFMSNTILGLDFFKGLSQISTSQNKMFSIIGMEEDDLIWTTDQINPFNDVSYMKWKRLNHRGHIPEELSRYKQQLFQNGLQIKTSVELLDFDRPHLKDFQYNAYHLGTGQVISVCVDAWAGALSCGMPVRIVTHTRPVIVVD